MKNLNRSNVGTGTIVVAAISVVALTVAYIFYRRKYMQTVDEHELNEAKSSPMETHQNDLIQNSLNMERYVFNLPSDDGEIQAVVEQGGECYSVHLNGEYAGSMWQDEEKGLQWNTHDTLLKPHLWEIAQHLSEAFSREGFPSLLMGTYPEILSTHWKSSETLEVILHQETDLDVFGTFLKDEILNLVTFEEHLDLMVKKEHDAYFIIVGIN